MPQESQYIPGICNINQAEIAYRRKAMYIGYVVTIVVFILSLILGLNIWIRAALLFLPLFIGVIGSFQVRNKFCVSYGASGKQNASDGDDTASFVEDQEHIAADKRKARIMNSQALLITIAILLATTLLR